jgi:hypothetical protein
VSDDQRWALEHLAGPALAVVLDVIDITDLCLEDQRRVLRANGRLLRHHQVELLRVFDTMSQKERDQLPAGLREGIEQAARDLAAQGALTARPVVSPRGTGSS